MRSTRGICRVRSSRALHGYEGRTFPQCAPTIHRPPLHSKTARIFLQTCEKIRRFSLHKKAERKTRKKLEGRAQHPYGKRKRGQNTTRLSSKRNCYDRPRLRQQPTRARPAAVAASAAQKSALTSRASTYPHNPVCTPPLPSTSCTGKSSE